MSEKLQCVVPFCPALQSGGEGETAANGYKWICNTHGALAPGFRRRWLAAERRDAKFGPVAHYGTASPFDREITCQCSSCCFARFVAYAIEEAVGIGHPVKRNGDIHA